MIKQLLIYGVSAVVLGAGVVSAAAETPVTKMTMSTPNFVKMAAQSDEFEIAEGKLAEKVGTPEMQKFGSMMVRDHTKTTEGLHAALKMAGMGVPQPPDMTAEQQEMMSKLKGLSGKAFDKAYLKQAVASHKKALELHEAYDKEGGSAPIVAASKQATPIVREHLRMAEHLAESKSGAM